MERSSRNCYAKVPWMVAWKEPEMKTGPFKMSCYMKQVLKFVAISFAILAFAACAEESKETPVAGNWDVTFLCNAGSYGYYWSSSLSTDDPYNAWDLDCTQATLLCKLV